MPKTSAGILMYRWVGGALQVLLVHPGGPFWANKDVGAWSIPKGEIGEGKDALAEAQREFQEETGFVVSGDFIPLEAIKQKGGKTIVAWAVQGDLDTGQMHSNTFEMEWPPKSGRVGVFPEIDKAKWFSLSEAKEKINPAQWALVEQLKTLLA